MMTLRRIVLLGAVAAGACLRLSASTPLFENFGILTNVPQIDATAFANYGDFTVGSILPYETQNTLYFTNTGRMFGNPGFRFEFLTSNSQRNLASNFVNGVDANIAVTSPAQFLPGTVLTNFGLGFENSQVIISAASVVNRGQIVADTRGRVRIAGNKVDLTRSSIGILPFVGGQGMVTPTNFIPDVGISDLYWGMDDGANSGFGGPPVFGPGTLARANRGSTNYTVQTPRHGVTNDLSAFGFTTSLRMTNAAAFVLTNAPTPSNWVVQAVFVQTTDTNIGVTVRFTPSTNPTNAYRTAMVEFFKLETNVLDGGNFTNLIYLIDRAASETNFVELTNLTTLTTFRPSTFEVTRATPTAYVTGQKPNWTNDAAGLIQSQSYSNRFATNLYSAYGFNVTNLAFTVPGVPGASLTNLPGRVELVADELNLSRTRLRGEGIVTVSSRSVISSNSVIDVPNLSFDLKSASGNLLVKGLAKDMIQRTTGDIFAWTGIWTNQTGQLVTNSIPDPNDPTKTTNEVSTNVIDIGFHVLVVDASRVKTLQPVFTASFAARGTNVVISDTLRIKESILMETENLTLTKGAQIILPNSILDWNRSNFPTLKNLTNEGSITLVGSVDMGTDTDVRYGRIVNRGNIVAFNQAFRADYFENTGSILSDKTRPGVGTISVEAGSINLAGGKFDAGGEIRLAANDLVIKNYASTNLKAFTLVVTNSISDGGVPTNNVISTEGFNFLVRPKSGDLLGTKIESVAPRFLEIPHTVVGEDRGPTRAGFTNNLAIGRLSLKGDIESLFSFVPAGPGKYALYVDYLELGDIVKLDIPNSIQIDPNVVVYFARSNVPVDQLDHLFPDASAPNGHLRLVPVSAGANVPADVVRRAGDGTAQLNQALPNNAQLGASGSGAQNQPNSSGSDLQTATTISPRLTFERRSSSLSISWMAEAGQTYIVEYTTDLSSGNWQTLSTVSNSDKTVQPANFEGSIPPDAPQRFFRVRPAR